MLTIEEWYGPFDKPRIMLTERDGDGSVLRRFDLTGLEYVQWTEKAMRRALVDAALRRFEMSDDLAAVGDQSSAGVAVRLKNADDV